MNEPHTPNTSDTVQPLEPRVEAAPSVNPAHFSSPTAEHSSNIKAVEKVTVWVMVLSAIVFALISILAIWGLFGDDPGSVIGRSLGTVAVIAFAALVVNVGANVLDRPKKK